MFNQYAEQFQGYLTPFNQLLASNVRVLEKLAQVQTELFVGVLDDGVDYLQGLSGKRDLATIAEAQRQYMQNLQGRLTEAARETYSVFALNSEQTSEVLQGAVSKVAESSAEVTGVFMPKADTPEKPEATVRPH